MLYVRTGKTLHCISLPVGQSLCSALTQKQSKGQRSFLTSIADPRLQAEDVKGRFCYSFSERLCNFVTLLGAIFASY